MSSTIVTNLARMLIQYISHNVQMFVRTHAFLERSGQIEDDGGHTPPSPPPLHSATPPPPLSPPISHPHPPPLPPQDINWCPVCRMFYFVSAYNY